MEKESFIFYRSFNDAIKLLPQQMWGPLYMAVADYALEGTEPQGLPPECMALFILMRPVIDINNKRSAVGAKGAEHGKKGGRPRKNVKQQPEDSDSAEVNDCEPASAEKTPQTAEQDSNPKAVPAKTPTLPAPQSSADAYTATYEEEIKRLHSEEIWIEQSICMRYQVDKATASRLIEAYYQYLIGECSEQNHRNFGHAKSHFHAWYRKASKAGFNLSLPQGRQRTAKPTDKTLARPSDYTYDGGFGGQDI